MIKLPGLRLPFFGKRRAAAAPAARPSPAPWLGEPGDIALEGFEDPSRAIRFGYAVIIIGLGTLVTWASVAPLAEGVPAQGVVVVESQRKSVAHLTGGTIASVMVRENVSVKQGDVLLSLDTGRLQTAYDTVRHEYVNAAARLARLTAEQDFSARIDYPEELRAQIVELGREDIFRSQEQLLRVRQQALLGERNIFRENLAASQSQAAGMREQLLSKERQASLLRQEMGGSRALVEEGYAPRNRLLEQERQLAELGSGAVELQTRLAREDSTAAELRLRLLQRQQEYLKEVETLATETRRELANLGDRLKDARLELDRAVVHAPVSGQVVGLVALAPGSVINPGAKLMEIVPADDKLLLDVQVPVHLINRIHVGQETDIRITTFPQTPSLMIDGVLQSLSADRHEPQNGLPPYFLARVAVSPAGAAKLGGRQLVPGMSADVVIKTGERSFMAYLMAPITRQLFVSFKEP